MLIHRMITKQVKNKQIKRKRVNVFKFQENKFQIVQNNLQEIKMILIKKRFGKTTSCNDHYMINMGGPSTNIENYSALEQNCRENHNTAQ